MLQKYTPRPVEVMMQKCNIWQCIRSSVVLGTTGALAKQFLKTLRLQMFKIKIGPPADDRRQWMGWTEVVEL